MLNQLYLITERTTKVENDCGTDWGFRVNLLYGEDRRYTTAAGFDSEWNDDQPLLRPVDAADVRRSGHEQVDFPLRPHAGPCGYESVMAPENFFYSHSYAFLYGQPTTITAAEGMYKIDDQWTANFGLFTGWNDWTDETNRVNYFGGFNWTSKDDECHKTTSSACSRPSLATPTPNNPEPPASTTALSSRSRSARSGSSPWRTISATTAASSTMETGRSPTALGRFAPYFIYTIDDQWSAGLRYEWFNDQTGRSSSRSGRRRSPPFRAFPGLHLGPELEAASGKNILVRSELRYDWASNSLPARPASRSTTAKRTTSSSGRPT